MIRRTFVVALYLLSSAATAGAAAPSTRPAAADGMFSLAGQAGLPAYLRGNAHALADEKGIRGGEVRTVARDLVEHDFTFDLVFRFREDEASIFVVGIGENGRSGNWITNSVCSRVHGPGHGGKATLTVSDSRRHKEQDLASMGKAPGPHLFRLQKRG